MLWIQYMAFYLHSADIDKARAIAERALKTISFRLVDFQFEIIFWKGSCILEWIEILQEIYCQGIFQESFNESLLQNTFFVLFPLSIFSCFPSPCSLFPFPFSLFPFPYPFWILCIMNLALFLERIGGLKTFVKSFGPSIC